MARAALTEVSWKTWTSSHGGFTEFHRPDHQCASFPSPADQGGSKEVGAAQGLRGDSPSPRLWTGKLDLPAFPPACIDLPTSTARKSQAAATTDSTANGASAPALWPCLSRESFPEGAQVRQAPHCLSCSAVPRIGKGNLALTCRKHIL